MIIEEVRIGNCIQYIENKECVILSSISEFNFLQYFEGIPINSEWLLKMGFSKVNRSNLFTLEINKRFSFEILLSIERIFIYVGSINYIKLDNIKYVHQIQNIIYSLTQTELTIK